MVSSRSSVELYPLKKIRKPPHCRDHLTHGVAHHSVYVVMQNENGPCPLLSIVNTLVLRGDIIVLDPRTETAGDEQFTTCNEMSRIVCNFLEQRWRIINNKSAGTEKKSAHQLPPDDITGRPSLQSVAQSTDTLAHEFRTMIETFPTLPSFLMRFESGLCVSPSFIDVTAFEYTSASLLIFPLLSIQMCHAWCIALDDEKYGELSVKTFDALMELQIQGLASNSSQADEDADNCGLAQEFLEETAGQITTYGLGRLKEVLGNSGEMVVFFCNNHFSTVTVWDNALYRLVTDVGYGSIDNGVVWERIDFVQESVLCSWNFEEYRKSADEAFSIGCPQDYLPIVETLIHEFPEMKHEDLITYITQLISCGEVPTRQNVLDIWLTAQTETKRVAEPLTQSLPNQGATSQAREAPVGTIPAVHKPSVSTQDLKCPKNGALQLDVQKERIAALLIRKGYSYEQATTLAATADSHDQITQLLDST